MDLQSLFDSLPSLPDIDTENLKDIWEAVIRFLPENSDAAEVIGQLSQLIPAQPDWITALKYLAIFSVISILTGCVGRAVLGKRSGLNHALSSVMGILFIYALTIVIYTLKPWNLHQLLSPLPYIGFSGEYMILFPIMDASFPAICHEVLSMVILAFLVNLIDSFTPQGEGIISWYVFRVLTVLFSMVLHFIVRWAFDTYLPSVLVTYAPIILLGILAVILIIGIANVGLGLVLTVVDPVFGAIYTFLFSHIIGKQLTKAVGTTVVLTGLLILLGSMGYILVHLSSATLIACIPVALVCMGLWYLIGHLL